MTLGIPNAWVQEGAWSDSGNDLLLSDVVQGAVRVLRMPGAGVDEVEVESLERPGQGRLEFDRPAGIASSASGIVLRNGNAHFIWLNAAYEPYEGIRLAETSFDTDRSLGGLYEWAMSAEGREIGGYGSFKEQEDDWLSTFFTLNVDRRSVKFFRDDEGKEIEISRRAKDYYTSIYDYSARLGESYYFLVLEEVPETWAFSSDRSTRSKSLKAFPDRFVPVVPHPKAERGSIATVHTVYEEVEKTSMPTGLYAGRDELFIMTREPHDEKEGTRWSLFPLDPEKDEIGEEITLPTTAAHIFLVPGSKHWAVVEKGSVEVGGGQTLESVLLLPTEWIEGETSPLHDGGDVLCEKRRAH